MEHMSEQPAQVAPSDSIEQRVVSAERHIDAPAEVVFELIADPSRQPEWDGNDNLDQAAAGQRVHAVGDVFEMHNTSGKTRQNHIVEFVEGRRIAWMPSEVGKPCPGHLWSWELEPAGAGVQVRHTYDWTNLTDENRIPKARSTQAANLLASIDRLAALAEGR